MLRLFDNFLRVCEIPESRDLNTTYGLNMELMPGGLLKQTQFDINVQTSPTEVMPLISVNIFAAGLSGIAGGDTSGNEVRSQFPIPFLL